MHYGNNQVSIILRNSNAHIDMFLIQDVVSVHRDIYLRIGSQRLGSGLSNGRHISQLHTFTTEEIIFGLFAPTHQPGDIYFDHISHMRRNLFRHHHMVGDNATYSIHLFDFYRCI